MKTGTIVEMSAYPGSRLRVMRVSRITGAYTCEFLHEVRPYAKFDQVQLFP
jgi:hypothetical protein